MMRNRRQGGSRWGSRKFWAGLVGTVGPQVIQWLTDGLGWGRAAVLSSVAIAVYIAGEAYVDGQDRRGVTARGPGG